MELCECNDHSLETVNEEIDYLRDLMYRAKELTGCIDDKLVIEISQFLDMKLNQQIKLEKFRR